MDRIALLEMSSPRILRRDHNRQAIAHAMNVPGNLDSSHVVHRRITPIWSFPGVEALVDAAVKDLSSEMRCHESMARTDGQIGSVDHEMGMVHHAKIPAGKSKSRRAQ